MARVAAYVGTLTKRAGNGTQDITGIVDQYGAAFTPVGIYFFSVLSTGATGFETADQRQIFGFSDGTNHASVSHASHSGSLNTSVGHRNDAALIIVDLDDSLNSSGVVSAITNGGFTVNWTTAAGHTGDLINFIAFGGSEVRCHVGDIAVTGSAGNQSVTGLSFAPDLVIFLTSVGRTATDANTGFGPNGVGWMTSTTQGASCNDTALSGTPKLRRYQRTDRCIVAQGAAGVIFDASAVSLNSDGFTVNWAAGANGRLSYLALGGVTVTSGAITAPTTSQVASITTTTMIPRVGLFMANGNIASTSLDTTVSEFAFGACDAGQRQRVSWSADKDAAGTTARYESTSAALLTANATSTLQSRGAATLNRRGVDINWTISSSDQAQYLYLLIGDSAAPVSYEDPCSIEEPRIYWKIKTEDQSFKIGIQPLRESSAMGGYATPRGLQASPITRAASDPSTGVWSAQTATLSNADTDRVLRAAVASRTSFRNCDAEIYLTSKAQSIDEGAPRMLLAGKVHGNSADPNLVEGIQINDLIGDSYSLFSEEKQIPQRVISVNWFPNAPAASLGLGEPIIGGRRAALSPDNTVAGPSHEGIVPTIPVGLITINGTHGTPTGTTLASVVAALQTSVSGGTTVADWGSRIGYGDAATLEALGTVPADYDGLAAVIGSADLDALLSVQAVTGGTQYWGELVCSHAIALLMNATNGDPSIWIDDTQLDVGQKGVQWWAPQIQGDTSWTSDIGPDEFTDIIGADGTTRRYTLILFTPGGAYGTSLAGGSRCHLDCFGMEYNGDGSGSPITGTYELYRHLLINFLLQDYQSGVWLANPQFTFSDGVTMLDRVDSDSFDVATSVAALTYTRLGSFTLSSQTSIRDVLTNCNMSWGCQLGQDDYQRLFIKILDARRAEFLTNRITGTTPRTLRDKVDFLPGFWLEPKPDWQVNRLFYQYAKNDYAGSFERGAGGGGTSASVYYQAGIDRDGEIKKTVQYPYVADDLTALYVAGAYRDMFANMPYLAHYTRRGLCGLQDDILDGREVTHYNGHGSSGWSSHAIWPQSKTFDPRTCTTSFTALDVDGLLDVSVEEIDLSDDPVALDLLIADDDGSTLTLDT